MLKPTAHLHFTLSADLYDPEDAATIKRTFSYVAPTKVTPGTETTIDILVKLTRHQFLDAADAQQQQTWDNVVCPWLMSKLKKIEDTLDACNNEQARSFTRHFEFDMLNLFLEDRIFSFKIDHGDFPAIIEIVDAIREKIGDPQSVYRQATRFTSPSSEELSEIISEGQARATDIADAPQAAKTDDTMDAMQTTDIAQAPSKTDVLGASPVQNASPYLKHERNKFKARISYKTVEALMPSGQSQVLALY